MKTVAWLENAQLIFVIFHTFIWKIWLATRPDSVGLWDKVYYSRKPCYLVIEPYNSRQETVLQVNTIIETVWRARKQCRCGYLSPSCHLTIHLLLHPGQSCINGTIISHLRCIRLNTISSQIQYEQNTSCI